MIKQQIVKIIKGHCTVKVQGENYAPRDGLDEAADKIASLFSSPEASRMLAQPQNDAEATPVAWCSGDELDNLLGGRVSIVVGPRDRWRNKPLYTAPPSPELERMRKALERSAQGWSNVLELGLLPERHRETAVALRDEAQQALRAGDNHASDGKAGWPEGTVISYESTDGVGKVVSVSRPSDPTPPDRGSANE